MAQKQIKQERTPEERKEARRKSRRRFLIGTGIVLGGSVAGLYFGRHSLRREVHEFFANSELPLGIPNFNPDIVFEMQDDNTLLIKSPKAEMGQGIFTGLAMMAAEELDIAVENIKVVPSSTADLNDTLGTGGSGTTLSHYVPMRETAATFREMLKTAAASAWGVNASQIQTADGFVSSGSNRMSYIDVVKATTEWTIPRNSPALRPASSFKVIGTDRPRIDLEPKVMGGPIFGVDAELPNMLHANILKCPYIEGRVKSIDRTAAEAVSGVLAVIEQEDLLAVVAENRYAAEMGKRALNAEWEVPHVWTQQELDALVTVGNSDPVNLQRHGNVNSLFENGSGSMIEAEYRLPTGVHAQMEPNAATADVKGDKALVITATQAPGFVRSQVASATGLKANNVDIQTTFLGGGFGRRYALSPAPDAARLSQILERPVQVIWDRETEFLCGVMRPSTHHTFRAKLSSAGEIEAIEHNVASGDQGLGLFPTPFSLQAILGADILSVGHGAGFNYEVENREANIWHADVPFTTGIWRAVGMYPNGFAIESFMDEVAVAAGKDPFDLRLEYLQGSSEKVSRLREVLVRLREESGWDGPKADGVGRGIAIVEDRRTTAASVIEVAVEDGQIKIKKVTSAIDPGIIINPDGVLQQCEGSVMMGISAALYEETLIEDGKFSASNYGSYPMALLSDTPPEIHVVLMELSENPSGVGEPPMGPIAPAIANAVFDLTGVRLRNMPLQKEFNAIS